MHKIRSLFCVVIIAVLATDMAEAKETITISVHDYAPYYNQEAKGFLSEIYTEAFKTQGVTINYRVLPIERGIIYFFSNDVDAHSPGNIFFNPEQMKKTDCVKTFKIMATWHYYKPLQKSITFTSLDDMKPYRLGIILKSPYKPMYEKHGLNIFEVQRPAQLVKKVHEGRDHFFEATFFSGLVLIKKIYPKEWKAFDYISWDVSDGSLAFLKNNKRAQYFKKKFEKGFALVKKNGTYIDIIERYWGKGNVPRELLPDDLKSFGTDSFDLNIFQSPDRTDYGEIIPSAKAP